MSDVDVFGGLPVRMREAVAAVCDEQIAQLKHLSARLVEAKGGVSERFAADAERFVPRGCLNALPEDLATYRVQVGEILKKAAVVLHNEFNASGTSLRVLELVRCLSLPAELKRLVDEDLVQVRSIAARQEVEQSHAGMLAAVDAQLADVAQAKLSSVTHRATAVIASIRTLTAKLPPQAREVCWDRVVTAIRPRSIEAWKGKGVEQIAVELTLLLLELPCSSELHAMLEKDRDTILGLLATAWRDVLKAGSDRFRELWDVVTTVPVGRRVNWSQVAAAYRSVLRAIESSGLIAAVSRFALDPRIAQPADAWFAMLSHAGRHRSLATSAIIAHLRRFPESWSGAAKARDELIAVRSHRRKVAAIIGSIAACVVVAVIIAVNSSDSTFSSSSSSSSGYQASAPNVQDAYAHVRAAASVPVRTTPAAPSAIQERIYQHLRRAWIIERIRPRVGDAGIAGFNAYVDAFNARYTNFSYYETDMQAAQARFNRDQQKIAAQAELLLSNINFGLPAE